MNGLEEAFGEDGEEDADLSGDGSSSDEDEVQVERQVSDLEATVSRSA